MSQILSQEDIDERTAILSEHDGIIPYNEVFYLQSIIHSAKLSMQAFGKFADAVICENDQNTFYFLQDALTQAAAVSRYFWPAREKGIHKLRAVRLRQAFLIDDNSPLRDRELRNALEHFDERLDDFLLTGPVGAIIPGPVVEPHSTVDDTLGSVFRLVDPWEFIIVIFGKKHEFMPIYEEVERVLKLASRFDEQGGRLPRN